MGCPRERGWRSVHRNTFALLLIGVAALAPSRFLALADESAKDQSEPASPQADGGGKGSGYDPSYDQDFDPGAPSAAGKLEKKIGGYQARFFGTVLVNLSASDSKQLGQDVPLWPVPGNVPIPSSNGSTRRAGIVGETLFTLRQSILGFQLAPAEPSATGWSPSGLVEMDFFGSRPIDLSLIEQHRIINRPRFRRGYIQLEHGTWRILAGQEQAIIAPLDPVSLSHVAVPLGDSAGDLWGWFPQVRVEKSGSMGSTTLLLQAGVLKPSFRDPVLNDLDEAYAGTPSPTALNFHVRTRQPFYQARAAFSRPKAGAVATVGLGVHYGREQIVGYQTMDSWALALDWSVPILPRLMLRGEGHQGSNLSAFDGGIIQGVAALPKEPPFTKFQVVRDAGGWAELTVPITLDHKNIFYAGAGTDDSRNRDLLPAANRSRNSFLWASYFRKLGAGLTLGLEWSNWDFQTVKFSPAGIRGLRSTPGRGNVLNIALACQF